METLTQTNTEVIQQLYADFGRGNTAGIVAVVADTATLEQPVLENVPYSGVFRGKAGAAEFVGHLYESVEHSEFFVEKLLSDEHTVVALGRLGGTVRTTGKPLAFAWAHRWELTDGQVTRCYAYADSAQIVGAFRK